MCIWFLTRTHPPHLHRRRGADTRTCPHQSPHPGPAPVPAPVPAPRARTEPGSGAAPGAARSWPADQDSGRGSRDHPTSRLRAKDAAWVRGGSERGTAVENWRAGAGSGTLYGASWGAAQWRGVRPGGAAGGGGRGHLLWMQLEALVPRRAPARRARGSVLRTRTFPGSAGFYSAGRRRRRRRPRGAGTMRGSGRGRRANERARGGGSGSWE